MIKNVLGSSQSIGDVLGFYGSSKWYEGALAAYAPKGAASYLASLVNLVTPGTYDAAPGVAPTWDTTNGWTFDGLTQYLNTGVVVLSGWSVIVRFTLLATTSNRAVCGGRVSGTAGMLILPRSDPGNANVGYQNGGSLAVPPAFSLGSGTLGVAGQQGYRNGVADGGALPAWSGVNTRPVYVGCFNSNGTAANFINANVLALAIYSGILSGPQMASAHAAIMAI